MESNSLFVIFLSAAANGIAAAIIGTVYRDILAHEPILHWWFRFGNRFERSWIFKPVWGCAKCISGQISLWSFLIIVAAPQFWNINALSFHTLTFVFTVLFGLILAVTVAILFSVILSRAIESIEK